MFPSCLKSLHKLCYALKTVGMQMLEIKIVNIEAFYDFFFKELYVYSKGLLISTHISLYSQRVTDRRTKMFRLNAQKYQLYIFNKSREMTFSSLAS